MWYCVCCIKQHVFFWPLIGTWPCQHITMWCNLRLLQFDRFEMTYILSTDLWVKFIYSGKALHYIQSKVRGRFRKILWPSQNIWTLVSFVYSEKTLYVDKLRPVRGLHSCFFCCFWHLNYLGLAWTNTWQNSEGEKIKQSLGWGKYLFVLGLVVVLRQIPIHSIAIHICFM